MHRTPATLSRITEKQRGDIKRLRTKLASWREEQKIPKSAKSSFVLLHAPLRYVGVPLVIIGQNPGKADDGDDHAHEVRFPTRHFLTESTHRYAFTAQALFYRCGRTNHLKYCQSTDMNLFRGLSCEGARKQSASALKDLIEILNPQRILINGLGAARSFAKRFGPDNVDDVTYGPLDWDSTVLVCPHFSRRHEAPLDVWKDLLRRLPTFLPEETERNLARWED